MNIHWSKMSHSDSDMKQSTMKHMSFIYITECCFSPGCYYMFESTVNVIWDASHVVCVLISESLESRWMVWHDCEMFAWHCVESCCYDQITPAETESDLQVYEDVLLIGQVCLLHSSLCVFLQLKGCFSFAFFLFLSEESIWNCLIY